MPTKPELDYAEPAKAVIASGATGHINYKVGIPDITTGYMLIFLFPLEGVRCWTPYGCANVNFRAGATAGYYEGSASWYVKYMTDHFKFANIPPGTYRLLSTCELYRDGTLVKTYWRNVDTGETITVGEYLPEADMVVTYLRFEPDVVYLGDSVKIWVNVGNEGKATGSVTVTCKVNGVVIGTKTVTRTPGHWAGLSFSFTPGKVGTYNVEVNELSGSFTVVSVAFDPWSYDFNGNGYIDTDEVLAAASDYSGGIITRDEVDQVVYLWQNNIYRWA